MERHLQLVGVRPELRHEYLRLHEAVWPEVEQTIRGSHIENYTIFFHDDLLIAYFEYTGDDFAADMRRMAEDPTTKGWWKLTEPCQVRLGGRDEGPPWVEVKAVWRLPA